jgi:hypothetical protein
LKSKYWLLGFGFFVSVIILIFYLHAKSIELDIGKREQIARAELINRKLERFVIESNLLSRFIQEDISGKKLSKLEVENKLQQYLRAAPVESIFGIGIWYEPFQFNKVQKLFGPYVHRQGPVQQASILSYEWNTEKYNYPAQDWYKSGLSNAGESFFIDPYFDNGLVYVSNSRSFFNEKKEAIGVITVDIVLPQLQNLVMVSNQSTQEMFYIVNRKGMLLAHPLKDRFFKLKNIVDGKDNQSLLNYRIEDLKLVLNLEQEDWIESAVNQDQLGWKIKAVSSKAKLLEGLTFFNFLVAIPFIIFWVIIIFIFKMLKKNDNT